MQTKFKHFKYLDKVHRLRDGKIDRHNKIRLDANERISPFENKFIKLLKKKLNSNFITAYPEVENLYLLLAKKLKLKKNKYLFDIRLRYRNETLFRSTRQTE